MSFCESNHLQHLCLKRISLNFDRYFIFFNSNVEESLLSCMKLVRKCYSDQLLRMLSESGKLKSEHLQFLINKYTKEIDMKCLKNCSFCSIEERLVDCSFSSIKERLEDVGSAITKFSAPFIDGMTLYEGIDILLGLLSNIQILELYKCNDRSMEIIAANCSQLKSLDVSYGTCVTDIGLTYLQKKKPPLESLNVVYTSVTYKSVALVLRNIPTLTKLFFEDVPRAIVEAVHCKDFSTIKSPYSFNLSNLYIDEHRGHLTDSYLTVCLTVCPRITDLDVYKGSVRSQNPLHNFLEMRGENLTSLVLREVSLSVETLAKCCPNLEDLKIINPVFEVVNPGDVSFSRLKTLKLQYMKSAPNESVARIISSSPNLRELIFWCSDLSDEMRDAILNCSKELRVLDFRSTRVTPGYLRDVIKKHTDLSTLKLWEAGNPNRREITCMVNDINSKVRILWNNDIDHDWTILSTIVSQ